MTSHVLETAAGLAFIYLGLAVFASALNEWIAAIFRLRSRDLEAAIKNMLGDDVSPAPAHGVSRVATGQGVGASLLGHSMIQNLSAPALVGGGVKPPAYLEAKVFSSALLDLLLPGQENPSLTSLRSVVSNMTNADLRKALLPLIDSAGDNMDRARTNIEDWYNQALDRLSGRYKRRAQVILLALGIALAVAINADSFGVAQRLWNDSDLRQQMMQTAQNYKPASTATPCTVKKDDDPLKCVRQVSKDVSDQYAAIQSEVGMPIGWTAEARRQWSGGTISRHFWQSFAIICGWLMTALAISLGAPFWFQFLTETLNLNARLTGAKPKEAEE